MHRVVLSGFLLGFLIVLAAMVPTARAVAATDSLPDLGLDHFDSFSIDNSTIAGHNLMRFTSRIVNVGNGPFELHGIRPNTSTPISVIQRIYNSAGTFRDARTPATMIFVSADGHNHWHIKDLAAYDLLRADGTKIATSAKIGFCFNDNTEFDLELPNAVSNPGYPETANDICGQGNPTATFVLMGLSVGWADQYAASLPFQWIDVTGLPAGNYTLRGQVDVNHMFAQMTPANDCVFANITLAAGGANVQVNSTTDPLQACSPVPLATFGKVPPPNGKLPGPNGKLPASNSKLPAPKSSKK